MPYIFPKRVLTDGDVLDPIDLNDDIIPVTEIYSGGLNEHNLKGGVTPGLRGLPEASIARGAFYNVQTRFKIIDPDIGSPPGPFALPQLTNITTADRIPNDAGWHALELDSLGNTTATTTDQNAVLWIEAQLQYAVSHKTLKTGADLVYFDSPPEAPNTLGGGDGRYLGENSDDVLLGTVFGARVQFAIRLDGAVLPWTITGHEDPNQGSPRGEKPSVAYQISSIGELLANAPGPRIEQDSDLGQVGNYIYPIRFGAVVPISAGSHTVEIVARRCQFADQTIPVEFADIISVYTRKLVMIEIPQIPRAAATFDSIEVTPFDSESPVTQAAFDDSIVASRTKLNAVADGALARGALRDPHLPTPYLALNSVSSTVDNSTTRVFPGWPDPASTTVPPPNSLVNVASPSWAVFSQCDVTYTSSRAGNKLFILADAHVRLLERSPCDGRENEVIGAIALAYSTNGGTDWTVIEDSVVLFNNTQNSFVYNSRSATQTAVIAQTHLNIPTMSVLTLPAATSGATYTVALVGCVVPTKLTEGTPVRYTFTHRMSIQRRQLSAIVLRAD